MSSHARDPFKYPLLDPDDEQPAQPQQQQPQQQQPQQHGARVPSMPAPVGGSGLSFFFRTLLPDRRSRFAFFVALVGALSVTLYWLVVTIRSKWLYALEHPQQVVSFEKASALPALFGMALVYMDTVVPAASVHYRTVFTGFQRELPGSAASRRYANQYINCTELQFYYNLALCQPADADGRPLIRLDAAPAGEMNGASALQDGGIDLSPSAWPLQFHGQTDLLCLTSHILVNQTAMFAGQDYPSAPVLGLSPFSVQSTLAVQQVAAAGHGARDDPVMMKLAAVLPTPQMFAYDYQHFVQFKATRTMRVDGTELLEYNYDTGRDVAIQPAALDLAWLNLLESLPTDTERDRLNRLKSLPDSRYMQNSFCFVPSGMTVQVVREVTPYGAVSFVSDLGGFLNLLTVALFFLFPLALKATEPRTFIPLLLLDKWKARKEYQRRLQQQQQQHEQQQHDASDRLEQRQRDSGLRGRERRDATIHGATYAATAPAAAAGPSSTSTSISMTPLQASPLDAAATISSDDFHRADAHTGTSQPQL